MNTAVESASRYAAEYESIASSLPGQHLPWLTELRANALSKFSEQGFPSPREEEWKYTNVSAIEKKLFVPVHDTDASEVDADWLKTYQLEDVWTVVLVDGRFSSELSSLEGLPDAAVIAGMGEALLCHGGKTSPRNDRARGVAILLFL